MQMDDPNYNGKFVHSCWQNDMEKVVKYFKLGVDVNAGKGQALTWAAYNENEDMVKFLLENGADATLAESQALRWAAKKCNLDIMLILLEAGADIESHGDTIIKEAEDRDNKEVEKFLKRAKKVHKLLG